MTRSEAATALGVSEKTVRRYIAAGRLSAQYVRGKTGQQLEIAPTEVERFQSEARNSVEAPPTPAPAPPAETLAPASQAVASQAVASQAVASQVGASLAPVTTLARDEIEGGAAIVPALPPPLTLGALARIVRAVMEMDEPGQAWTSPDKAPNARARRAAQVPLESKLLLSLDEAAALAGVPRAHLDSARRQGQLNARKIGRGFKIRRGELEQFVTGLWEQEDEAR